MSQCALSSGIDPSAFTKAGIASAAINAVIVTIQFTLPLFIGIVLAGVIRNASTASTWSVISTILHNSRLHTLFSSDSVAMPSRHISPRVLFFSYLGLLSLYLTAISSVITPLGIKETLVDRIDSRPPFEFAFNNDTFSLGTAEREKYKLMRVCGSSVGDSCPGQEGETVEVDENDFISATPSPRGQDNEGDESLVPTAKTRKPSKTSSESTGKSKTSSRSTSKSKTSSRSTSKSKTSSKSTSKSKTSSKSTSKSKTSSRSTIKSTTSSAGTGKSKSTTGSAGTGTTGSAGTGTTSSAATGKTGSAATGTTSRAGTGTTSSAATGTTISAGMGTSTGTVYPTVTTNPAVISPPPPASLDKGASGDPASGLITYPAGFGSHAAAEYATMVGIDAIAKLAVASSLAAASDYAAAASAAVAAGSALSSGYMIAASVAAATSSHISSPPDRRLARRQEDTKKKYRIGSKVPEWLTEVFKDVSYYGASVANVFDIQFRNYIIDQRPDKTSYTIGQFRFLETLILESGYKLIDGLVVDMTHGGVGIRKHALPHHEGNTHGAGWHETLLWITPETVCEPNILSLEVTVDINYTTTARLRDTGGFNWMDWGRKPQAVDASQPPNLGERAWSGAYYFNEAVAAAVGKTGGGVGSHYSNTTTTAANKTAPMFYAINRTDHAWVEKLLDAGKRLGSNPFAVHRMPLGATILNGTQYGQTGVDVKCTGLTPSTRSGAPLVTCGLIIGAADSYTAPSGSGSDSPSDRFPGTFHYPLYTCATAFRASLQNTYFSSKPSYTRALASVTVHNTTLIPKPPLWGVESYPTLNSTITQISPLWGPLQPDRKRAENMTVSEGSFLYLPAGQTTTDEIVDSLSGTSAYQYAANLIYTDDDALRTQVYSGDANYALYQKWQRVTGNAATAADLPGLVWTDVFANLVTSESKGGVGAEDLHFTRCELYYDMRYGAPALVLLCLWGGMFAAAVLFWVGRRVRMKQLRQLLNQVSTGRVVVNMLQQSKEGTLSAGKWAQGKGGTVVGLQCRRSDGAEEAEGWGKVKEGHENEEGDEKELEEMVGTVVGFVEEPEDGIVMDMLKSVR